MTLCTHRMPVFGETLVGSQFDMGPGGKGSNQAVAAARLGAESHFVGIIGSDPLGKIARTLYEEEGVHAEHLAETSGEGYRRRLYHRQSRRQEWNHSRYGRKRTDRSSVRQKGGGDHRSQRCRSFGAGNSDRRRGRSHGTRSEIWSQNDPESGPGQRLCRKRCCGSLI